MESKASFSQTLARLAFVLVLGCLFFSSCKAKARTVFPEARITVYWQDPRGGADSLQSSTGVTLKNNRHVAVDPALIPYGSKVHVQGWGVFTAVDTGPAVRKRTAARKMGKNVPVVDVFFTSKKEALEAVAKNPVFSKVEIIPNNNNPDKP